MKEVKFTEATAQAINAVSQDVAADLDHESGSDPEIVAEMSIDADRLTMWGFPEADKEIDRLIEEFGYDAVLKAASKIVSTW